MKYRKKPLVIDAVQWTGLNLEEVKTFARGSLDVEIFDTGWKVGAVKPSVKITIHTLEGDMIVNSGDYIIKGVDGEIYPCKPGIFSKIYEEVADNSKMRLIDADALSRKIVEEYHGSYSEVQLAPYEVDAMIEAQPTVSQWAPCSERLPEPYREETKE